MNMNLRNNPCQRGQRRACENSAWVSFEPAERAHLQHLPKSTVSSGKGGFNDNDDDYADGESNDHVFQRSWWWLQLCLQQHWVWITQVMESVKSLPKLTALRHKLLTEALHSGQRGAGGLHSGQRGPGGRLLPGPKNLPSVVTKL